MSHLLGELNKSDGKIQFSLNLTEMTRSARNDLNLKYLRYYTDQFLIRKFDFKSFGFKSHDVLVHIASFLFFIF